jgi:signal transduction histidine kinase
VVATLNNTLAAATLLAGSTPSSMAEVDLDAFVGLVVADIGPEARTRVVVESASDLRTVQLQPTTMRLALTNLLFNALSYSSPGSPVRLRVSDGTLAPALCFEVIDEGEGIAPALRRTVLEKGRRGPTARPGTGAGLGLYIVQRVVDQHRGSLELLGNEPHGTIARILIPQGVDS